MADRDEDEPFWFYAVCIILTTLGAVAALAYAAKDFF